MKKTVLMVAILFSSNCFSMSEEEKNTLRNQFSTIMTNLTSSHKIIDAKIYDPAFPLEPLVECLNFHRTSLEKSWMHAFQVDRSQIKEIDGMLTDTCKKLTALTLLHKHEQRKKNMLWNYWMARGSAFVALVYTPLGIYFNKEFRAKYALPFFAFYASLGAFFHARRAHIKAQVKPMLSDAVKEVLPDLPESRYHELAWLKPDLAEGDYFADKIGRIEAENMLFKIAQEIPDNRTQELRHSLTQSQSGYTKLLLKKASHERNIDAVLRLAYLQDPNLNGIELIYQESD